MLDLLRFFSFLFKDEPVPAVLLLAFRFAVKKFLDFLFFLYFFLFRRCFSRRRKILNLFSCFLSLYFTRIFYRLSFSLHFLFLSKNFRIFSLHRTFLSSSSISSSSKRILVLVTINYWKIFSFFFFFFHNNETLNRFIPQFLSSSLFVGSPQSSASTSSSRTWRNENLETQFLAYRYIHLLHEQYSYLSNLIKK